LQVTHLLLLPVAEDGSQIFCTHSIPEKQDIPEKVKIMEKGDKTGSRYWVYLLIGF
jgi:hypothetical protein